MKLLVFILDDVEKLETLLCALSEAKISGATIVESAGMARSCQLLEERYAKVNTYVGRNFPKGNMASTSGPAVTAARMAITREA